MLTGLHFPDGILPGAPLVMLGFACCLTGLRRLLTSRGLSRMLPMSSSTLRLSLSTAGVGAAVLWSLGLAVLAVIADTDATLGPLLILWVALAAAVRWCGVHAPDYSTGLIVTDVGIIPLGALLASVHGWDLLLIGVSTLLVGGLGPVSIAVCVACVLYGFLHG